MKKVLATVTVLATLLTVLTMALDLPEKVRMAYLKFTKTPPSIKAEALFANQEAFSVSPVSKDKAKGYSHFVWPSVYEVHNVSRDDVTITGITNTFADVKIREHLLNIKQVEDDDSIISVYDDFQTLVDENKSGVTERLPYTVKPGTKKYIKFFGTYGIENNGNPMFCNPDKECYKLASIALGVPPKDDGTFPCVYKAFDTRIDFVDYRSMVVNQKAIVPVIGCRLNMAPILDLLKMEDKS